MELDLVTPFRDEVLLKNPEENPYKSVNYFAFAMKIEV